MIAVALIVQPSGTPDEREPSLSVSETRRGQKVHPL